MTRPPAVIVPQPRREPPVSLTLLVACGVVLVTVAVVGEVGVLAIQGRAAAYRPVAIAAPVCPVAKVERTP